MFAGVGTFSRVYLAKRAESDEYFAIKKLSKAKIVKLNQVRRVFAELCCRENGLA